jgi:hypothetical protein
MGIFRALAAIAAVLLMVSSSAGMARSSPDLAGEWTGESSGNHVTIKMKTGGFSVVFAQQQRAGQADGSMFFREAGSGTYIHTFDTGGDAVVKVLGPDSIRVTNPDGWTDVFRRPQRAQAIQATPAPTPKVTTKSAEPGGLPAARRIKEQAWSPRALAVNTAKLDPKYAAERADMLASCAPAIQQWLANFPTETMASVTLLLEQSWLSDQDMDDNAAEMSKQIADQTRGIDSATAAHAGALRAGVCLYQRRLQQLQGSPLSTAAINGALTPLSLGGSSAAPPPGKDAHIIASNGRSAKDCVVLAKLSNADSNTSAAVTGRVLLNQCADEVEIGWCYSPGDCETETGSSWTLQPGRSWPIKAEGEVRWAACHGANTASFVKYSHGLRYYCKAATTKPSKL